MHKNQLWRFTEKTKKTFTYRRGSILFIAFLMTVGTLTEFIINYKRNNKAKKERKESEGNVEESNRCDIENNNENIRKHSFEIKNKTNVYKVTGKEIRETEKNGKVALDDHKAEAKGKEKEPSKSKENEMRV